MPWLDPANAPAALRVITHWRELGLAQAARLASFVLGMDAVDALHAPLGHTQQGLHLVAIM